MKTWLTSFPYYQASKKFPRRCTAQTSSFPCVFYHCTFHNLSCSPVWTSLPKMSSEWSNHGKYPVVLQLLGYWCSCYNNDCVTKLWAPYLNFSIYTWRSWHYFCTVLYSSFQCSFHHSKLKFVILKSYEISTSLSWILNSIQFSHSEHIFLQALLSPIEYIVVFLSFIIYISDGELFLYVVVN